MAHNDQFRGRKQMGGRTSDIALGFFIVTIPMLLFAAVLLGLVFAYRVTHNHPQYKGLQSAATTDEPGIYYVNLNATFLVFIASWSSSLAPILVSFVLALAAYPICRQYLGQARSNLREGLLTPYQLALTLRFMNGGGFGAIWSWLTYHVGWRQERVSQGSALRKTALVSILATSLAIVVFLADTWLHVTTKSVNFIQISPVAIMPDYSFSLIPACTIANQSLSGPNKYNCSIHIAGSAAYFQNATQSLEVLNNASDVAAVFVYESNTQYTYLGIPQTQVADLDYTATTFGMATQCKPVTDECIGTINGIETTWHCADTWQGDLGSVGPNYISTYFPDAAMSTNNTWPGVPNPYYWGYAAIDGTGVQKAGLINSIGTGAPNIAGLTHGGVAFLLFCTITHYDIEYDTINGTVTRFVTTLSNNTVADIWQIPVQITGLHGAPTLLQATDLGLFSKTAQDLADQIALAYSRSALALGAQSVMRTPALAIQQRESFQVSRVPAAPLYTLVIANLLFVVFGVVLTCIAFGVSGGEVREVQARLSIVGLVADRFEQTRGKHGVEKMDDYFEEKAGNDSMRLAIDRSEGDGFSYKVWPKQG